MVLAVPIGVLSAIKLDSLVDRFATVFVLIGVAAPNFWLGLLLIELFAVQLGWLPAQGFVRPEAGLWPSLKSLILPSIAVSCSGAARIARMTRSGMLDVLRQDHVRIARQGYRPRAAQRLG